MRRGPRALTVVSLALVTGAVGGHAGAASAPAAPVAVDETPSDGDNQNDSEGYTPPSQGPGAASPIVVGGYVDVGFARAQGDGTSFAPGDTRLPADYGVDTFATAVNARGDVASTDSHGLFVNGFLPHSVGIGGRASFLVNTVAADLKYAPPSAPLMIFTRVLALPRFSDAGDATRVVVEQAFGRLIPFDSLEAALAVGKFDSVFGIEYLDNEANIRTGITPSLIARYTTGQSVGAKVFFRQQIAPLWSALSINAAATNQGTFVDVLQTPDVSLTGVPVVSARLGYELNLRRVQVKLGTPRAHVRRSATTSTIRPPPSARGAPTCASPWRGSISTPKRSRWTRTPADPRRTAAGSSRSRPGSTGAASTASSPMPWSSTPGRYTRSRRTPATSSVTPGSTASRPSPSTASRRGCASICGSH